MSDQAEKLRQLVGAKSGATDKDSLTDDGKSGEEECASAANAPPTAAQCMLFTSGKGGVGTSNLVLNLAIALGENEQRVLVFDGDVGLANLDLLGGLSPRYDLGDVLQGRCEIADAIVSGPGGIQVVAGAHAARTSLGDLGEAAERVAREVKEVALDFDFVLIDAGSGLGQGAGFLAGVTDDVVVVSTPEPTSLVDAHAAITRFHQQRIARVRVVVNQARSHAEGVEVLDGIVNCSRQFRGAVVAPLGPGFIRADAHVPRAVRLRRPFMTAFPYTAASRGVRRIARALCLERCSPGHAKGRGFRAMLKARFLVSRGEE